MLIVRKHNHSNFNNKYHFHNFNGSFHPRPQGSRIFYDAREPKTVYGAKIRRPLEHSVQKYTNFVYFEAAAWKSWVDRSQTTRDRVRWGLDESTFLREAFVKLTAWTQNQVERRDFIKRRSLLDLCCLEYVLNVIWWVLRHVQADKKKAELEIHTHRPGRPDQTDQILRNITIYTFELTPHHSPLAAISQMSLKNHHKQQGR